MTCYTGNGFSFCVPSDRFLRRIYLRCPTCECITETVERHELWYGVSWWCCRCGDSWQDGYLAPRPFARGWRKRAVEHARRLWDRATYGPPPTFRELLP